MKEKINNKFPKHCRLLKKTDFDVVFNCKNSAADKNMIVYFKYNSLQYNRLGIVIGRKVGNAVKRNRFKRIVREAFRKSDFSMFESFDIVVLPRKPLNTELSSIEIEESFTFLIPRVCKKTTN